MLINSISDVRLAVIGLGYVGLPLAVAFANSPQISSVIGYDINSERVRNLNCNIDHTKEVSSKELRMASNSLMISDDVSLLTDRNVFIVTVPTPVSKDKTPDLSHLKSACKTIGRSMGPGAVVIFESTVYPGATEEVCVPVLEDASLLEYNKDFFVGYSPERANPGDPVHKLTNIIKVVSGSTDDTAIFVDNLYKTVIFAGTHRARDIKTAEAAKVIENTQRDINIALVNELSIIFNKMGIDTKSVLDAAKTKWNFLDFRPGLVGGHCIGVDPYYLAFKALQIGIHPNLIMAGRTTNDKMATDVAEIFHKKLNNELEDINPLKVLIMGITFKENCPDIRNTKVIDLAKSLEQLGFAIDIYDPLANHKEVQNEFGISLTQELLLNYYDGIIIAVAHQEFMLWGQEKIKSFGKTECLIMDLKYILDEDDQIFRV